MRFKTKVVSSRTRFQSVTSLKKGKSVILIPKKFKKCKYRKLLKVIINHEKNEACFIAKYPGLVGLAHNCAKSKEGADLRKNHLSRKRYEKLTKELGYVVDS